MIDNTPLLKSLIKNGQIRIRNSDIFQRTPQFLPDNFNFEKVEGMLLGLAVGDALGANSEGMTPRQRHIQYGEITNFVPGRRSDFKSVGIATDDTQLSFWTIEQLLDDGGLCPDNLAQKFCKYHISGIGNTTKQFIKNYKDNKVPWYEAGLDSLGNGALMRIAPITIPYLRNPHPSLFADAALDTMITHNSFANNAANVAFIKMLWELLGMSAAPNPAWWIDEFCLTMKNLEGETKYRPQSEALANYEGSLWKFTNEVCHQALLNQLDTEEACNWWGSGANLFETIPSVLYLLAKYGNDPEKAIIRAVNDTYDNDTIAAIVGAAMGALYGLSSIPMKWLVPLQGNIREKGRPYQVFRLTLLSKVEFWSESRIV